MQHLQSERLKQKNIGWMSRRGRLFICLALYYVIQSPVMAVSAAEPVWPDEEIWMEGMDATPADTSVSQVATGWRERLSFSGYLKNETAYRYDEPRSITKIRNILSLTAEYPLSDNVNFLASGWAYHDLAYQLFDYETISGRFVRDDDKPLVFVDSLDHEKDSPVIDLREVYMDIFLSDMDIRLGKQFIIWGVFDGIRITDEINPQDFRELNLPDLLDYRIPLWSVKLDYYYRDSDWEFIWIPDIRFHKPAPRGSEWELLQEVSGTTLNGDTFQTTFPHSYTLASSEIGLRYRTNWQGVQLGFSYFHTWDDFPVIFRTIRIDSSTDPEFFPTYTRINIFGATLVKPVGETVVKAEVAWVPDKYFGLNRNVDLNNDGFLDGDGVVKLKHYRWGLGVDFNLWGIDLSPAITQWIILDYQKGLIQDWNDMSFTLFARKPLPQHATVLQLLAISLINMQELYLKPKVTFDVSNQFKIAFGMDLFYGARSKFGASSPGALSQITAVEQQAQFFGNFHNNDRVFAEFKYAF